MGKAGRKLTRKEKEYVLGNGKNPKEYIFLYDINDSYFKVKNKLTGVETTIDKYRKAKNKWDF